MFGELDLGESVGLSKDYGMINERINRCVNEWMNR
jgi:hypothetical protein